MSIKTSFHRIKNHLSATQRAMLSSLAAFVAYGGWSLWANIGHGLSAALTTLTIYGSYAACSTFIFSLYMEWGYRTLQGKALQRSIVIVSCCLLMYACTISINLIAGTPELLLTILPGIIIGTLFCVSYVTLLSKQSLSEIA